MVISKLEKETAQAREECERAAENRIKCVDHYSAKNYYLINHVLLD